jgi:hypothetical protein
MTKWSKNKISEMVKQPEMVKHRARTQQHNLPEGQMAKEQSVPV